MQLYKWRNLWGRFTAVLSLALILCLFLAACSSVPRTTRMTLEDMDLISQEMAASLAASPALRQRTPQSPPWVISIDKVQNLTSDVMTAGEQWAIIAKVRGSLPIQTLSQQKNVRFVIPAEQVRRLRDQAKLDVDPAAIGAGRQPTHQLSATFRSVTRAGLKERTELYYCEFQMLDLANGEPAWTDRFEYKRAAHGHIWD